MLYNTHINIWHVCTHDGIFVYRDISPRTLSTNKPLAATAAASAATIPFFSAFLFLHAFFSFLFYFCSFCSASLLPCHPKNTHSDLGVYVCFLALFALACMCIMCVHVLFVFYFLPLFFFLVLLFAVAAAAAAAALSLHTIYIAALAIMHCAHTIRKGKEDNDVDDDGECLWCKRPYRYGIHTIRGSICFFFLASFYSPSTIHPSILRPTHTSHHIMPPPSPETLCRPRCSKEENHLAHRRNAYVFVWPALTHSLSLSLLYVFASCIATPQCTYVYDVRRTYP